MPVPTAQAKYILSQTKSNLSGTKFFCLRQNILSMAKNFISATYNAYAICPDKIYFVLDIIFCPWLKSSFLLQISPRKLPCQMKKSISIQRVTFYGLMQRRNNLLNHGQNILSGTKSFLSGTILILSRTKYILSLQMVQA